MNSFFFLGGIPQNGRGCGSQFENLNCLLFIVLMPINCIFIFKLMCSCITSLHWAQLLLFTIHYIELLLLFAFMFFVFFCCFVCSCLNIICTLMYR